MLSTSTSWKTFDIYQIHGVNFILGDIRDQAIIDQIYKQVPSKFDIILSDAAPEMTGQRVYDHAIMFELHKASLNICWKLLKKGGSMLFKTFAGPFNDQTVELVSLYFNSIAHIKPLASRRESNEVYIYAKEFLEKKESTSKLLYLMRSELELIKDENEKEDYIKNTLSKYPQNTINSILEKLSKCGFKSIIMIKQA